MVAIDHIPRLVPPNDRHAEERHGDRVDQFLHKRGESYLAASAHPASGAGCCFANLDTARSRLCCHTHQGVYPRGTTAFFTVSSIPTSAQLPLPGAPPTFELLAFDPISQAVAAIAPFSFGKAAFTAAQLSQLTTAAQSAIFPNDPAAQTWAY